MNCFNHPTISAIGMCKACNKGLCRDCLTDLGIGIACKDKHEETVKNVHMVIDKTIAIQKSAPKTSFIAPVFYLFMGIVFMGFSWAQNDNIQSFPFVLGAGFMVFGIAIAIVNYRIFRRKSKL